MKEKARSDREVCISIGKIEGEAQVTSNDTGWSEEEKERMRQAGYDDMDIIREGIAEQCLSYLNGRHEFLP